VLDPDGGVVKTLLAEHLMENGSTAAESARRALELTWLATRSAMSFLRLVEPSKSTRPGPTERGPST